MTYEGLIAVDKPVGPTSHDVIDTVRSLVGLRRVGHTGTLDPAASGLLLVCIGRATRLVRFLQEGTKVYTGRFMLGVTTDTLDATGAETGRKPCGSGREAIARAMESLVGTISQTPPMASAIKTGGRRLYDLARGGESVEREPRPVHVSRFGLTAFEEGDFPGVDFEVECGKGTYVRSLVADVGDRLGCGAHLVDLRRTKNGPYTLDDARTIDQLRAAAMRGRLVDEIRPLDAIDLGLPTLHLGARALRAVRYGAKLDSGDYPEMNDVGCDGLFEVRDGAKLSAVYRVTCSDGVTTARAEVVLAPAGEEAAS